MGPWVQVWQGQRRMLKGRNAARTVGSVSLVVRVKVQEVSPRTEDAWRGWPWPEHGQLREEEPHLSRGDP